jgi:hypothetical protein
MPLTGGAYQARSVIAAAQRCVNLYVEPMPQAQGEPAPAAHYPTPGLRLLGTIGSGPIRGIRQASNGLIHVVSGSDVFLVNSPDWSTAANIGSITAGRTNPVSMADNGTDMVLVDGTIGGDGGPDAGWHAPLTTPFLLSAITDPNFYGADRVDYLDGYFLFNKNGTPQFYSSDFMALTFDPLWIANKIAYSDLLRSLIVSRRNIWLIGDKTTELWSDVGAPDFPFQAQADVMIDHGVAAIYSVAGYDSGVFWLSSDRTGQGIVLTGSGYQTKRISTYAIETEIAGYSVIYDAVGFCYQYLGHTFYVLNFPTADKTWVYDITTGHWHEWAWTDPATGLRHRHRANCYCAVQGTPHSSWIANGTLVVGDWENGNIYALDHDVFTDNGAPIQRIRSFPHMVEDGRRVFYSQFLADIETGTAPGPDYDISLRWSDDRGHTYGNPVVQSLGASNQYLTSLQWQRLGMARDRVWELSWTVPAKIALQGAWINAEVGDAPTAAPAGASA